MRIATWNVNHLTKRLAQVLAWLERTRPDVLALQELKAPEKDFPREALAAAGYEALVVGQRSWNGVALLARGQAPLPVARALPGDADDREARYVEAAIGGVLFGCLYLPNGNPWPGPKFDAKMRWFARLEARAAELMATGQPVVLLGDWNVVPTDRDIYKPDTWRDNALLQPEPRAAFARVLAQGWSDALAAVHPEPPFTFWDYRRQRWERDAGLRIDHILLSPQLAATDAGVDRDERGRADAPDHAPVWAEIGPARKPVRARPRAKAAPRRERDAAPLAAYEAKRDFERTAEPAGRLAPRGDGELQFVIQKHWASRLHYDVRLELDGVMLSWAVPKGPSVDPAARPIAIQVEDHPLAYNEFEGEIPKGEYGGGRVLVWDRGTWEPVGDPREGLVQGKLVFRLHGQKLAGLWEFVRISRPDDPKQDQWLLLKKRDAWARPVADYDVIRALPDSVVARPLGLVEAREPERAGAAPAATRARGAPDLSKAVAADLPERLEPQLASLAAGPPRGDWIVESKLDGYRLLARVDGERVRLFTRNGHDWTSRLKPVAAAVARLGPGRSWLDGEIVVTNDAGLPDFGLLQKAIDNARTRHVQFFVFDLPFHDGRDLRAVPLWSRRALLRAWLDAHPSEGVRLSESFDAPASAVLAAACKLGLEGVMAKRADAPYDSGRTETWLKLKCRLRQEFVVAGFVDREGAPGEVGSLLLAYHEGGTLRFGGAVGTGWDAPTAAALHARLAPLETRTPALDPKTVRASRPVRRGDNAERWVAPTTVVEVSFAAWTPDGHVRSAVYRGLRADKPASDVGRERAAPTELAPPAATAPAAGLRITHPERVVDPSTGLRKIDLLRYYESVADRILPHLRDRPVSLVRAPQGLAGALFFQKHPESRMPGLTELDPALWPGHPALLAVDSAEALLAASQLNTIEFHTWNSTASDIDRPDRVVFDLDPGEGTTWRALQEAALLMRTLLTELGLRGWLKTSGGKGLHIVVPLAREGDVGAVRDFARRAVRHMARTIPARFVARAGAENRTGKVFIDYLRNNPGQTTAAAFSARARPGMGVSMPVAWEQLHELKGGAQWTIATAREYLSFAQADPWADYWGGGQSLAEATAALPG